MTLVCEDLRIERGGRPVVSSIDLQVQPGAVTVLLGANGAGKTTVIEAVSGLLPTSTGRILLNGNDITRLRPVERSRRGLAVVQQGRTLFATLSVADNLEIVQAGTGSVDSALEIFPEMREKLRLRAGLLSGGEQQMLILARALVTDPTVLLIDEMSLGLAPRIVRRLLPLIRDLAVTRGIAVLVVEQFATLALEVADQAYVLRRGTVTYAGPATDLVASPQRLDDAYFGSSTLHPAGDVESA